MFLKIIQATKYLKYFNKTSMIANILHVYISICGFASVYVADIKLIEHYLDVF